MNEPDEMETTVSSARRTIRIDEDVFEFLQRHAEALTDTPNNVLRRLLGLPVETRQSDTTKAVLDALRAHPGETASELATRIGSAATTVSTLLKKLEHNGLAKRTKGSKRPGGGVRANHWWPTDTDPADSRSTPASQASDTPSDDTQNPHDKGEPLT